MATYFFEIRPQLIQAHRAHFKAKHQVNRPGNELAVIRNVAGDAVLVKVNSDEQIGDILPPGLIPSVIYTAEEARELLKTPEWRREI